MLSLSGSDGPWTRVQVWPPLPRTHSTVISANSRLSKSRKETGAWRSSHSQRRWHRGQRQNVSPSVKISSTAQHSDAYSPASRVSSEVLILGLLFTVRIESQKAAIVPNRLGVSTIFSGAMIVKQSNLPEYHAKLSAVHHHALPLTSPLASSGRLGVGPSSLATR